MAETYCGKSCAECSYKETLNCPGCHAGPGRSWSGECELARCIRGKGHETCETCSFHDRCGTLASRERIPAYRIKKNEAEKQRAADIARHAPVLGKWLWLLFWLIVPNNIASLMTAEPVMNALPALRVPGEVLALACNLAWGLILMKLATEADGYNTAGVCYLLSAGANFLASFLTDARGWAIILLIPAVILGLVAQYKEYMTHATVLTGVDNELSENWERLWKWQIGSLLALLGSVVLTLIVPILGLIIVLAAGIAVLVVGILRLVYLYKTAKIFRDYCQKAE